jgi:branched-chain amino acid aminotransferase
VFKNLIAIFLNLLVKLIKLVQHKNIPAEIHPIHIQDIVKAAKNKTLKEIFGTGTAAVVNPIKGFGYKDDYFELESLQNNYADYFKNLITKIQRKEGDDVFNWTVKV